MSETIRKAYDTAEAVTPDEPLELVPQLEEGEPFPADALGPLQEAAAALQEATQAPFAICAQSVLGAASLAVQGHADVVLPTGQARPTSLFLLSIAGSGERKSAVDSHALKPVRAAETALRDDQRDDLAAFHNSHELWNTRRTAILNGAKKGGNVTAVEADLAALGAEPRRPLDPVLLCTDATLEGLHKMLDCGQPSIGLFNAEGGLFTEGVAMTAENRIKTATGLSSLWDGDTVKRIRSGDGVTLLVGKRVALHLMMQPRVAMKVLGDQNLVDQGIVSRMLIVAPESRAGTRFWQETSPEARLALYRYQEHLSLLLAMQAPLRAGTVNELEPRPLPLSPAARKLWVEFHDNVEGRLAVGRDLEPIRGLAGKAGEHAARLAAVLALWSNLDATEVSGPDMARGASLAYHYLSEARRLLIGASANQHLRDSQQIWDWVVGKHKGATITIRDVQNGGPHSLRDKARIERCFQTLVEHGHLSPLPANSSSEEGRCRRRAWSIHGRDA